MLIKNQFQINQFTEYQKKNQAKNEWPEKKANKDRVRKSKIQEPNKQFNP